MTLYGLMAEFADAADLLHAARQTHEAGYRRIDAYSPFAIEGMDEALQLALVEDQLYRAGRRSSWGCWRALGCSISAR